MGPDGKQGCDLSSSHRERDRPERVDPVVDPPESASGESKLDSTRAEAERQELVTCDDALLSPDQLGELELAIGLHWLSVSQADARVGASVDRFGDESEDPQKPQPPGSSDREIARST